METNKDQWLFFRGDTISIPVPEGVTPIIYVIGDSHVRVLPQACPDIFKSSQVDIADVFESKSAYAIGGEGHEFYLNEALLSIPDGSQALLSFGEIDCRHYIPKVAIARNQSIESLVDEVFERYTTNCVRLLKDKFRVMILPPYICPEDLTHENLYSDIIRAKSLLNGKLKTYCEDHGLLYIPIFSKGINEGWHRKPTYTYFNDSSHLGPCMVPVILDAMVGFKWKNFDY